MKPIRGCNLWERVSLCAALPLPFLRYNAYKKVNLKAGDMEMRARKIREGINASFGSFATFINGRVFTFGDKTALALKTRPERRAICPHSAQGNDFE
jgi:hypothetical protein